MEAKVFVETILLSQEIHEKSWNKRTERYEIDLQDSALKACLTNDLEMFWADVVYLLNSFAWNDIQDWANLRRR